MADYRRLLESLLADPPPFTPTRESATAVQVERGATLADVLAGRPVGPVPAVVSDVVDAAGHRRPLYRPLLVHALKCAGQDVQAWAATLSVTDVPFTAAQGSDAAALVWSALVLGHAGTFRRLVAAQQPNGAFLRTTSSDNPETHWFHELVVLHAAADFALETGDAAVWAAVERAALFHLDETEPDHATGDPWGLPAFARVPAASPLADVLLHAVSAHRPAGPTGVGLLLLADTLYGLRSRPEDRP